MSTMAASPIISRSSFAAIALVAAGLGACAGHAAPKSNAPAVDTPAAGGDGGLADCAARTTKARALLEAGKPWSATRALEGCTTHSQALSLLVRANLGLGKLDEASRLLHNMPERDADLDSALHEAERVQKGRKPVVDASLDAELDAIRESLARGQCPEAGARARQSFERWTPNPKALALGGAAASCQGDAPLANSLYARAAAELERLPGGLAWYQPKAVSPRYFSAPNELAVRVGNANAVLHVASTPHETAILTLDTEPPTKPLWRDAQVEVVSEGGNLVGRAVGTAQILWKRNLPDGLSDVVPAFSTDELLLVHPDLERFRSFWYRLESRTGKVVSKGTFPDRYSDIMASTNSDWFAATAMTQEQRPHLMHLVFTSGRVKSIDLETLSPCSPNAVLLSHELLMSCGGELRALSVDTLHQRSLVRFPDDFTAGAPVRGPGKRWALSGRTGLALVELAPDGGQASPTILPALEGYEFHSVEWSPTGRFLAGEVVRADGRRGTVLLDLESSQQRFEFWTEPDPKYPDAALSATGDELVMGGCTELARLHLDSGRFEMVPIPKPACVGLTVAPTTGVLRMSPYVDGDAVFWPENGLPRAVNAIPYVKEAQAAGPWVAANTNARGRLLLPGTDRSLALPPHTDVLALSPDGSYAALHEIIPGGGANVLLFRLNDQDASSHEVWRLDKSEFRYAAFTPDSRALMLWSPTSLGRVDVKTPRLARIDARWPERGVKLLGESSRLLSGYSLIPLDDSVPAETAIPLELQLGNGLKSPQAFPLLGSSRQNRWIVGPIAGGAAIWSAPKGELVAQIQHSPTGGWFVSAAGDADTQRSLVQPLGTEHVPLWCRSGNELYEWRVCQDRFEEPTLLRTLLTGRSQ